MMASVVRLDWLDNMLPGERIHLWVLTWDAEAGEFRGISSADWGPAAQVRITLSMIPVAAISVCRVPRTEQMCMRSFEDLGTTSGLPCRRGRFSAHRVAADIPARQQCCGVQVLSAAGAAWFIGGEESDVTRVLQARQQPDSNSSAPLQWAHFPRDTWQLDHWDAVPVGGHPSAAYMSAPRREHT